MVQLYEPLFCSLAEYSLRPQQWCASRSADHRDSMRCLCLSFSWRCELVGWASRPSGRSRNAHRGRLAILFATLLLRWIQFGPTPSTITTFQVIQVNRVLYSVHFYFVFCCWLSCTVVYFQVGYHLSSKVRPAPASGPQIVPVHPFPAPRPQTVAWRALPRALPEKISLTWISVAPPRPHPVALPFWPAPTCPLQTLRYEDPPV